MESNSNNLGIGLENTPNSICHILIKYNLYPRHQRQRELATKRIETEKAITVAHDGDSGGQQHTEGVDPS